MLINSIKKHSNLTLTILLFLYFSDFDMEIDWGRDADRELFKFARAVRIRRMKKINIWNFEEEQNKELLDYFTHNWPDQLREFNFNADTGVYAGVYGWADYYLDGIAKVG